MLYRFSAIISNEVFYMFSMRKPKLIEVKFEVRWITVAMFLSGIAEGLCINFHAIYLKHLGANPMQIGLTLGASSLACIFVYFPAGWLADRYRRKPLIITAWTLSVAAFSWISQSSTWQSAVPGFVFLALSSFSRPAFSAHLATITSERNLSQTFATIAISWSLGSILSPAAGGWIAETFGLPRVFLATAAVYIFGTAALIPMSNPQPHPNRIMGYTNNPLYNRVFIWQVFVLILIVFSINFGVVLAPNYLQEVKLLSLTTIGTLGAISSTGMMLLTVMLSKIRPERRISLLFVQLAAISSLLLLLLSPIGTSGKHSWIIITAFLLRGGIDAIWTPMSSRLSLWIPSYMLSQGFSYRDTGVRVALTLAPVAAGLLYAIDPELPLYVAIGTILVTLLLTMSLPNYLPTQINKNP